MKPIIFTVELPIHHYINGTKKIPLSKNTFVGMNRYVYYKIKKEYTEMSILPRLIKMMNLYKDPWKIKKFKTECQFVLKNKRVKDPSNFISKIMEFYLDALVKYNFVEDDSFENDKGNILLDTIYDKNALEHIRITLTEIL